MDRIFEEMQICIDEEITVHCAKQSIFEWRAFVPRPLPGSGLDEVLWVLAISFKPDHPHTVPMFRFLSIPALRSVSALGYV
jgi:ubiquitin-protein ligase